MLQRSERIRLRRAISPTQAPLAPSHTPLLESSPTPPAGGMSCGAPAAGFDFSSIRIGAPESGIGPAGGRLDSDVADRIQSQRGGGAHLGAGVQQRMEHALGAGLGDVRVHSDRESDALNSVVGASAFTLGSDVFLSREAASPAGGDAVLAHELTHVVQQRGGADAGTLTVGAANDAHEREAEGVAQAVARGGPAPGRITQGAQSATIRRQPPAAPPQGGSRAGPAGAPTNAKLAQELDLIKTRQAAMEKKQAAMALDLRWRAKFGERMASYKQAVYRVTAGIDMAQKGFQDAQVAQAQTDALATQLIGVGVSFLFAGGFEWIVGGGLRRLGVSALKVERAVELMENPANIAFGGYMTNIRGARQQQETTAQVAEDVSRAETVTEKGQKSGGETQVEEVSKPGRVTQIEIGDTRLSVTEEGQKPEGVKPAETGTEKGQSGGGPGGGAVAYLARKQEALEQHWQNIEKAFGGRSAAQAQLTDEQWATFDVGRQEKVYQELLAQLEASGSGVEKMETVEYVANIIEKYMWADWILRLADRQSGGMLHNFGTDIDLRLIKIGVEAQVEYLVKKDDPANEFGLSEHWWQHSTDNWREHILKWARAYKGSILK